jgi:hypothetical protein
VRHFLGAITKFQLHAKSSYVRAVLSPARCSFQNQGMTVKRKFNSRWEGWGEEDNRNWERRGKWKEEEVAADIAQEQEKAKTWVEGKKTWQNIRKNKNGENEE